VKWARDLVLENRQTTLCAVVTMLGNSFGSVQSIPPFVLSLVMKMIFLSFCSTNYTTFPSKALKIPCLSQQNALQLQFDPFNNNPCCFIQYCTFCPMT
jgi:hypothetical protein